MLLHAASGDEHRIEALALELVERIDAISHRLSGSQRATLVSTSGFDRLRCNEASACRSGSEAASRARRLG